MLPRVHVRAGVRLAVTVCFALSLVGTAREARAQLDLTGPWATTAFIVFATSFPCSSFDFVQTGTSFTFSGLCGGLDVSGAGTINLATGHLDATGSAGALCPMGISNSGSISSDQTQFQLGLTCSGGPLPILISFNGFRCGNGVVDAVTGEECDDGNRNGGDCCNQTCHLDPPGAGCLGDTNQCTDDVCDAAGTCLHPIRTGPCDDFNQCTSGDTCVAGSCVGTILPDGSACHDFNDCTDDSCQGGTCTSTNTPDGTPCDDGYDCTSGETCLAGQCGIGNPVVCPACQRCFEGSGCLAEVFSGAALEYTPEDSLQLKKTAPDSAKWKWVAPRPLTGADFGDPTTTTGFEFCVFDENSFDPVTGAPSLLFGAGIPAGAGWEKTANGFSFKSADRKIKLRLKGGRVGQAKILMKARGPTLAVQYLPPLDVPVTVHLRTAEGVTPNVGFASGYYTPVTSTAKKYKAQNP